MKPRWHKVLSDLTSHGVRSLLVIASIAVGLFAIGMLSTTYVILSEDIRSSYRAINPANIYILSSPFTEDFLEHIRRNPEVAAAEGAWITNLQVRSASGDWKPITFHAQNFTKSQQHAINQPLLLEGIWPPDDKEIVLDVNRLSEIGAKLGDVLEIKLPSGVIRRMEVVGIVKDQTVGATGNEGGFFLAVSQGYVTADTLSWLGQPVGFNTLMVTARADQEDKTALRRLADGLVTDFETNGIMVGGSIVRRSSDHPNVVYVDAISAVMYLLGFLVVFLSGFLITNTFSALLNQQVQQIGIMKTIGASRGQIVILYSVLILVYSTIAVAISIPLANSASFALLNYLSEKINFHLTAFRSVPASMILQIMVALVVPQLAGSFPIAEGTRISVREALNGSGKPSMEVGGLFTRLLKRGRGVSRPLLISLRNTFRKRWRLLLTVLTLTLGGATFIATLNVRASLDSYISRLGHYFLADVNLTLDRPYRVERVVQDVMQVPGVSLVEGGVETSASLLLGNGRVGETVSLVAPPIESHLTEPVLLRGRWLQPGDQNAITLSELFLETIPGIQPGDTVRLKIRGKETDWIVVGFFQFAGRSSGLFAYTNYEYLSGLLGMANEAWSYRIVASEKNLTQSQQEALGQQIETHLTGLGYKVNTMGTGSDIQESTSEGLDILTTFLLIMSFLLAAVGSIGLAGTMSLNVMERTKEIGVMRAIGASNQAIVIIVMVEGLLIGLISWILSCIATIPLSKQLADTMFQIIFDRNAALALTPTGPLIWLGIVLLLSMAASVLPAVNASRMTIREVLAYE